MKKLMNVFFITAGLLFAVNISNAQQKIGHLDSQAIFSSMPEAKTMSATLEALQNTKKAEIEKLKADYATKYQAAVAKNKTLSAANKDVVSKELETMSAELDAIKQHISEAGQKAEQELAAKQNELGAPLQTKFIAAVKAVAKEKKIAYVFDISSQQGASNVLAWEGGDDVTDAVKAKLGISGTAPAVKKS
ncbi:OmpH family outer membrane protein [Pedobacter sp. L105]|uniref:OmpH family outer membrane protein n=1 Tax=Pedobacter sp. L105 TaxID=1641871 RepID=UPI00131AF109|nr:OmpH family outer membrane protein [Pedobacter sp. L105]